MATRFDNALEERAGTPRAYESPLDRWYWPTGQRELHSTGEYPPGASTATRPDNSAAAHDGRFGSTPMFGCFF